jgi:hypothetical protein
MNEDSWNALCNIKNSRKFLIFIDFIRCTKFHDIFLKTYQNLKVSGLGSRETPFRAYEKLVQFIGGNKVRLGLLNLGFKLYFLRVLLFSKNLYLK